LAISLAQWRRRSRCDGVKESGAPSTEAGPCPAPAARRARAPRVRLA
jgi:hypothetical protein